MDPWLSCQNKTANKVLKLKFEDNFATTQDRLPDSDQYLAALEKKLHKIKTDPSILRQLTEKRDVFMQQLLNDTDVQFNDENLKLDAPVDNSLLLRIILPQKAAVNQGEIVYLLKNDQLDNEDEQ